MYNAQAQIDNYNLMRAEGVVFTVILYNPTLSLEEIRVVYANVLRKLNVSQEDIDGYVSYFLGGSNSDEDYRRVYNFLLDEANV